MADLRDLDVDLYSAFYAGHTRGLLVHAMRALSALGRGWLLYVLAPAALWPARWAPRWLDAPRRQLASETFAVLTVVAVTVNLVKGVVGRPRPFVTLGTLALDGARGFSFPSGHSASAFALLAFFWCRLRLSVASSTLLAGLAAAIAVSRLTLGVHYPSDVLAGSLLGTLLGAILGRRWRAHATMR